MHDTVLKHPFDEVLHPEVVTENLQIEFDGVVYLTDGYATTPTVIPYCKSLWIVTPDDNGGTQENSKNITYPTLIYLCQPMINASSWAPQTRPIALYLTVVSS